MNKLYEDSHVLYSRESLTMMDRNAHRRHFFNYRMPKYGIQLFSLYDVDPEITAILERVSESAFSGVEFANMRTIASDIDDVRRTLDNTDLEVVSAHYGLGITHLEDRLDRAIDLYHRLETDIVALAMYDLAHFKDPSYYESSAVIERASRRLRRAAEELAENDLELHYHNHTQELVEVDGKPALEHLIEGTENVYYQLDTGWLGTRGYDPIDFLNRHHNRIKTVHLRDYRVTPSDHLQDPTYDAETGESPEMGEGDLELEAMIETIRQHDIDWVIYEYTHRRDSYETLENAEEIMSRFI